MAIPTIMNTENMTLLQSLDLLKREYDEETVLQKMKEVCLTSNCEDIQKKGMEFFYNNGFFDELQRLIHKNEASTNASIRKWAKVYQIALDVNNRNYNPINIIERVDQCNVSELELQWVLAFARIRANYQMDYYQDAGSLLTNFDQQIQEIDDLYLRKSFRIRFHRAGITYRLMQNEVLMARKHGYKLLTLSRTPCIHVASHIKLGLSYTFDSYIQAMFHFQEALKIAKQHNFTRKMEFLTQRVIPFVCAHYNKVENITTTDIGEQAHLEIAKGNREKAIEILEQTPMDTPFKLYYLGKAKQDRTILVQAYREFVYKRNDYFFCRLPLGELKEFLIG